MQISPLPSPSAAELRPWTERYVLERIIGRGGMAIVWRAWDTRLQAWRAIKILRPEFSSPTQPRQRFEQEARTMARLHDPHIVTVHDIGENDGQLFIVMEWLSGGSLQERLARHGPLAPRQAAILCAAVLRALHAAHREGVVHRDVKPSNVLLSADGRPALTDFGIARVSAEDSTLTRTGVSMGTMGYMAPEQREDARGADHRADLYAAGAMLWTLLTNRAPLLFVAPEAQAEVSETLPEPLAAVVLRATRYTPAQRYASAAEMAEALDAIVDQLPQLPLDVPPLAWDPALPSQPPRELSSWLGGAQTIGGDGTWLPQPLERTVADAIPPLTEGTAPTVTAEVPRPGWRGRWILLSLLLVLLGVSVGLWGGLKLGMLSLSTAPTPTPIPPPVVVTPPVEVVPEPEPEPEPVPEVVVTEVAPEPEPEVGVTSLPPREPTPREPEPPLVVEATAPTVEVIEEVPARVRLEGALSLARVVSTDGSTYAVGPVPPGTYRLTGQLPERKNWVDVPLGRLASGAVVLVRCDDQFGSCRVVP